jgi:hypothetical protein
MGPLRIENGGILTLARRSVLYGYDIQAATPPVCAGRLPGKESEVAREVGLVVIAGVERNA